ncbi:PREDICTED: uncharacterized protein LOC104798802 [Tarenaya hassleriana]|uniref:uncharacterized protein LOC104798802 n=1 Tax=Tarenaya hassleriana TaxID=28532 RepID=UPI00053C60E5|nr:PREDICTED: uncharacterized protein LOC104798802 [Tarenaya hassleriana]
MAISHLCSFSLHPLFTSSVAKLQLFPPLRAAQFTSRYVKENNDRMSSSTNRACFRKRDFCCAVHMTSGQSGEPEKLNFENLIDKAKSVWDNSPQPIKDFPWDRAFGNFIQIVLDLVISVVKYLCVPLLAISSVSEMSYCAHERKLSLVPFPLVIGVVVAGILRETALEISPRLKDAEVPWHFIAIMIFFTLLKLPGPYYPYWGRILIPHFANGVLWRTLWSLFFWYKRPRNAAGNPRQNNSS